MSSAPTHSYPARFRKVLEYIDAPLDEDLAGERVSNVAAYSRYRFHRQFTLLFGISVYSYSQLSRLTLASYQLAFREESRITEIALASGYEGPYAFSRAFKKSIGQAASEFRSKPQWEPWVRVYQPLSQSRRNHMKPKRS